MTEDASIGVVTGEIFQQLVEGVLLGLSAGIGRMTLFIEASLIDNAKGAPVVAFDSNRPLLRKVSWKIKLIFACEI